MLPALDNGELAWAVVAVATALEEAGEHPLAMRFRDHLGTMVASAKALFYRDADRSVRNIRIKDTWAPIIDDVDGSLVMDDANRVYEGPLGDPYEGELMFMFVDLFCDWSDDSDGARRREMWAWVRRYYGAAEYDRAGLPAGPITVQKGWRFSTHELWKYLVLPYRDNPLVARVLANGERARTWNSHLRRIPGLLASTFTIDGRYVDRFGIECVSGGYKEPLDSELMVTPYGAYPLMLVDRGSGLAWHRAMVSRPRMQCTLGCVEAGQALVSPPRSVLKATGVGWICDLAALGGLGGLLGRALSRVPARRARFDWLVEELYSPVFTSLKGESTPFAPPPELADSDDVASPEPDFSTCVRRSPPAKPPVAERSRGPEECRQ